MNAVPVANQGKNQQQNRDQQQAGSLRRVDGTAAALVIVLVLGSGIGHADIVALWNAVLGIGCQV